MKIFLTTLILMSAVLSDQVRADFLPSSHAGWKTLTNKNGWSIQYPQDWMLDEDYPTGSHFPLAPPHMEKGGSNSAVRLEICGPASANKKGEQIGCITIASGKKINRKSTKPPASLFPLKEIAEATHSSYPVQSARNGRNLKINGFPAYEVIVTQTLDPLLILKRVVVKTADRISTIEYWEIKGNRENFLPDNEWQYEKVFDEMITTIKFNN